MIWIVPFLMLGLCIYGLVKLERRVGHVWTTLAAIPCGVAVAASFNFAIVVSLQP